MSRVFNEILMTYVNLFQILNISWLSDTILYVMEENCTVYTVTEWDVNGDLKLMFVWPCISDTTV